MGTMLLLLLACGSERGVREAPTEVSYGGWIYDGPSAEGVFTGGDATFQFEDEAIAAEEPYEGYPGYWMPEDPLPPDAPFQLTLSGAGSYTTAWAGDTPSANGYWLPGYLFAMPPDYWEGLVEGLGLPTGQRPDGVDEGGVHLWGLPLDEDWQCEDLLVNGEAPRCYAISDDGVLSAVDEGPIDWFFAFDLEPGEVVLDDGLGGGETWTVDAGTIVMALWLAHG